MDISKQLNFDFSQLLKIETLFTIVEILLILIVGLISIKILSGLLIRLFKKKITPQTTMIIRKTVYYGGLIFIIIFILNRLGIELTPLLGAAGIAGIAIGFAAQTSVSNIISGLFLISEKPFALGDVISLGSITGIILSIDLLSIKIRTFDNKYIRIPNEKILNNELTNITRFPIRRLDIEIRVAYKEDVKKVRQVLLDIAKKNPNCLSEPGPLIVFKNFGDSGLEFLLGLWFEKSKYLELKNSIMDEIKERFDKEGIEIPFPHLNLYTGSATEAFPIKIIQEKISVENK